MLYSEEIVLIIFLGLFGIMVIITCTYTCIRNTHLVNLRVLHMHMHMQTQNRVCPNNIPMQVIVIGTDAVMIEQPSHETAHVIGVRVAT